MNAPELVTGAAHARAGLLGNPSDGYGGKAIAIALADFRAHATIQPSDRVKITTPDGGLVAFATIRQAAEAYGLAGTSGGLRLVSAALHRFLLHAPHVLELDAADQRLRFSVRFDTDIPRQVGLSGSSAIVIAVMRGLAEWFDRPFEPAELAEIALAAEVEELGLAGGPMDRVIQVYGGVVLMDLREPRTAASYHHLDPALLPPLFVAWDPQGAESSGVAHGALRRRWESGDDELRAYMREFRGIVDEGLAALGEANHEMFRGLMDRNFELRARFFPISDRDREAVAIARRLGAAAKLCGSGGAIIGSPAAAGDFELLARQLGAAGFEVIRPQVAAAS